MATNNDTQNEETALHNERLRLMGSVLTGVAHDFNNIMTVILGYCDLATSLDVVYTPNYCITQIREAALRATKLTGSLLSLSQRGGKQEEFHPALLFQDIAPLIAHLSKTNVQIRMEVAKDLYHVKADYIWLEQSILNLLLNAVQASSPESEVLVRCYNVEMQDPHTFCVGCYVPGKRQLETGAYLVIEVEDYGCGIAPDVLPRIFEQFFTTKMSEKNSGIGLANVLNIVEAAHGHICVCSKVNQGTTVRILLPQIEGKSRSASN
ncbi:MAG: hypothetical protein JSS50_02735 [Proteobacteria bacterium]|nr:hypothetical protein [Pseudomonadota bacterium]